MLSINISDLILTILSFFLLLFLLNKFLYQPVLKFTRERQARIDAQLDKERAANEQLAENERRIEAEKAASRDKAKAMLAEARREEAKAHDEQAKLLAAESAAVRQESRRRVEQIAQDTKVELAEHKEELADVLAERLIGK